jgi:hypothetical protein
MVCVVPIGAVGTDLRKEIKSQSAQRSNRMINKLSPAHKTVWFFIVVAIEECPFAAECHYMPAFLRAAAEWDANEIPF